MKKTLLFNCLIVFVLLGCQPPAEGWEKTSRVLKVVDNITYIFPADVPVETRTEALKLCEVAIKENLELLGEEAFTDTIKFEFFHTRADMELTAGRGVKGMADPGRNAMYSLVVLDETSPIKHELMHMILFKNWGYPSTNTIYHGMFWFNEGLATYSGSICGEYNFAERYYYFLTHDLIIPMDTMVSAFYQQNEVIGYTQGAYIVKYLSDEYGWVKMKEFWQKGFDSFEEVFGISYTTLEEKMHKELAQQFPDGVELDWEQLKRGCP